VDASTPSLRFFLRRISGTGNLTVRGTLNDGVHSTMVTKSITGSSSWAPSPVVPFAPWNGSGNMTAQFLFTSDASTVYRIDDVYIDPWKCC
jgi:hypothetical protein